MSTTALRRKLARLERLAPRTPAALDEPLARFVARPEVQRALKHDAECIAAKAAAYRILCEVLESNGERPPADFLAGWPDQDLKAARRRRGLDPDKRAWVQECRPEADRICVWMQRTPGFDVHAWARKLCPDFGRSMLRLATAHHAVLRESFGYETCLGGQASE